MSGLPVNQVLISKPRTRLNNSSLKQHLKSNFVPNVINDLHVVGVRCVFDFISYGEAVKQLAARRRIIEKKLLEREEIWLIISSITALEKPKKMESDATSNCNEENTVDNTQTVPSSTPLDEEEAGQDPNSSMNPGVSFWIGVKMPDVSLQQMEQDIFKMFDQCGFSIYSCRKVVGRNVKSREDNASKALFQCIKDYNWSYAEQLSRESTESFLRTAIPGAGETQFNTFDPAFGSKVVRITISIHTSQQFAKKMRKLLSALSCTGFEYDRVDTKPIDEDDSVEEMVAKPGPSFGRSKLIEAIDLLIFSFDEFNCRYKDGYVYEKVEQSMSTFMKKGTLREYLCQLCASDTYREIMTNQLNTLVQFFDVNPDYQGVRQLEIDMNLIEVSNGWYFNIEKKCFLQQCVEQKMFGVKSPRAYFDYSYDPGVIPYPKEFVESIRHSLTNDFETFIHIDEWAPDAMAIDEAKRVFQGGVQFIPKKHGVAKRLEYNSGIYVTMNEQPYFGASADGEAMVNRLRIFQCKALKKVIPNMEKKYKEQTMEIIHWMSSFLGNTPLFEEKETPVINPSMVNKFLLKSSKRKSDDTEIGEVNETILTQSSIEKAHMDVYDQTNTEDVIPFRLVTYDVDHPAYHRSVYHGVTDRTQLYLKLVGHNLPALFEIRYQQKWSGKDSLYDAWLLSNGRQRWKFNVTLFTQRYPDWKQRCEKVDLGKIITKDEGWHLFNGETHDEVVVLSD